MTCTEVDHKVLNVPSTRLRYTVRQCQVRRPIVVKITNR